MKKDGRYRSICCLCHCSCGFIAEMEGGRLKSFQGDPEHPANRGYLCPKAASMEIWQSNGTGRKIVLACGVIGLLIFNAVNGFFLYTSWEMVEDLGEVPDIGLRILFLVLSLLIVALGLWMPIVKRNAWFGVRTKWTMESETVWVKSQKFGGKLFAAAGLVSFISVIFPMSWMMGITCVSVFAAAVGSALYSRREGLREKSEKTNNKL